jgi:hypothetical protein
MSNQQLNEGLRPLDLDSLVSDLFEIDTFRSKMGEDRDICVLSFRVRERQPAIDMMEFIEKGFNFVLDADISAGENTNGEYTVFVEIPRKPKLKEYIKEIADGIKRLTGINEWYFRYYKSFDRHPVEETTLEQLVPNSPLAYDGFLEKVKTESIKKFFNKTLMDDLTRDGDVLTIHKPFNQQIKLQLIDDNPILENIDTVIQLDHKSVSETLWLTKVLGDYNITKYGDTYVLENQGRHLILKRIE